MPEKEAPKVEAKPKAEPVPKLKTVTSNDVGKQTDGSAQAGK